jgi:hypothetical protein
MDRKLFIRQRRSGDRVLWALLLALLSFWGVAARSGAAPETIPLDEIERGIVRVTCESGGDREYGTGFIVNSDEGYLVTSYRVVEPFLSRGTGEIWLDTALGERVPAEVLWPAPIVSSSLGLDGMGVSTRLIPDRDLAILVSRPLEGLPSLRLTSAELALPHARVQAVGIGSEEGPFSLSPQEGSLRDRLETLAGTPLFQMNIRVDALMRGAPLIDVCGSVVGICFSDPTNPIPPGDGLALQADVLMMVLDIFQAHYTAAFEPCERSRAGMVLGIVLFLVLVPVLCYVIVYLYRRGLFRSITGPFAERLERIQAFFKKPPREGFLMPLFGDRKGERIPIRKGIRIGRDPKKCNFLFPNTEREISKTHAAVYYDPDSGLFELVDSWSKRGTFLMDGTRLNTGQQVNLKSGEQFYLTDREQCFVVYEEINE